MSIQLYSKRESHKVHIRAPLVTHSLSVVLVYMYQVCICGDARGPILELKHVCPGRALTYSIKHSRRLP